MSYFDDVRKFHEKFGLDTDRTLPPGLPSRDVTDYRVGFLQEETYELILALQDGNLEEAADALADLVYVALGTAHLLGLPFEDIWNEVQRANLEKERARSADDPRSKRRHTLDVVKPEGWQAPDHALALAKAAYLHSGQCEHPTRHKQAHFSGYPACGVCGMPL